MMKEKSKKIKSEVIAKLKSLIFPIIMLIIIGIGVYVVINYANTPEEEEAVRVYANDGSKESVILENNDLKLVMDPTTTQFSLEVKKTGKVWYSNPQDIETDNVALANELNKLQSTITMTYSNEQGLETLFNSYEYSIANGIYEIEKSDDSIRVNYSMGNVDKEYVIPPVIRESDLEAIKKNMKAEASNMVQQYYKKYDINKLGKKDNKDELLEKYPVLAESVIYVLRDSTKDAIRTALQGFFEEAGYTFEQYQADKELDLSNKSSDKPVFNVSVIYRLEGDDLVVEVPYDSLEFRSKNPIYAISVLPYFGAGSSADNGFMVVPEGSGAIINFNNGKTAQNTYYANVYGWDMCLIRDSVIHNTEVSFNTFGISDTENSFLCIMEEGAPYAAVRADISGRLNNYNYANAVYSIMLREQYDVGDIANSSIYVYLPELPDEKIVQRYSFINSGDYIDMAKEYKNYLDKTYPGVLTQNDDAEAPVVVEVVGAVDKVKQVLGVPVSRPLKLTKYSEAQDIITELKNDGLNNMSVKMTGWCNGGENQKVLNSVKTISDLGSKKDLQKMINAASDMGIDVYLDGVTDYAYDSNLFNGFNSFFDAARFISKEKAEIYQYSRITYSQREGADSYFLLRENKRIEMMDNLVKTADKYNASVSFRDVGSELSADYYKKRIISRQQAQLNEQAKIKEYAESGKNLMINTGNVYAAVYSDVVTNMDLKGSEYTILDKYIPFYEIALHGYVNYTGKPANISGDVQEEVLKAAEYGAGLYFTLMRETAFPLQKTLYTEYYGADYAAWHDRLVSIYNRYNSELGGIFNCEMVGHQQITNEMACTEYSNGTKVYVNYSYADATTPDGVTVPARDYKVVR